MQRSKSSFLYIKYGLLITMAATLIFSCTPNRPGTVNNHLKQQLDAADSLCAAGFNAQSLEMMHHIRPQLANSSSLLAAYYASMSQRHARSINEMNLYADSAIAFFNNREIIDAYPDEYFEAAIAKGDAALHTGKYVNALDYYDQAKRTLPKTSLCDDGNLSSKMGVIYYGQKNFKYAVRYWTESYHKLEACNKKLTPENLFFEKQGKLDNIALCYEMSGMPDSARYFYMLDLKLINSDRRKLNINEDQLNAARIVLYDNLGGFNLKQGNLTEAARYLNMSLAIPYDNHDGARIPPLVKLAELEIKSGNYQKATDAFRQSRVLLNRFQADNFDSEIRWNRVYALYLAKTGKKDSAYFYLNSYISKKRLVDSNSSQLYHLNVEREMQGIHQQQSLNSMAQKVKVRKLYIEGFAVIALLLFIIIYLIYRNLQKSKRNHREATLQNHQLQDTLNELERVNKNYIRIMRVMAHDLRNPISGIIGLTNVLLIDEDELTEDNLHVIKLIASTGAHSIEMINELLKTGLADENEQVVTQSIDLRSLLYDSVELLQFKAKEKGQQIFFEGTDTPVITMANHEKMWRVFNNLIVNAIKFSHQDGHIRAGIKADEDLITIWVADDGIGIPLSQKDSVFEMFTPAKKEGTAGERPFGLGLSISKKIIEQHRGKIWFESEEGKGTTFYIRLPR